MRVFRTYYKDRDGIRKHAKKWYVDFADHLQIRHRIPAFEDKRQSEALGRNIEKLVNHLVSGEDLDRKLEIWLNCLPTRLLEQLAQWGLISGQRSERMKPLSGHINDYIEVLRSRKHSNDYVNRMEMRINKIADACNFNNFRDITKSSVELYLGKLEVQGLGATTRGHYLDAFKTFMNWAKEDCRIIRNPLKDLSKKERDSKQKGILRPEQFIKLIQTTVEKDIIIQNTAGPDRAVLYFLAGASGLRRRELLSLRWDSLHAKAKTPYILAKADTTKNSKEARQPIPQALADILSNIQLMRQARGNERMFEGFAMSINTAKLIREDLKTAGINLFDKDGNEIVFHSLRNSYISFLANEGVPAKVIQKLARHSDPRLTFNTYARVFEETEQEAVQVLPDIGQSVFATSLAKSCGKQWIPMDKHGQQMAKTSPKTPFLAQKYYPQGDSNPCYRDENPAS